MPSFYARDFGREFDLAMVLGSLRVPPPWHDDRWARLLLTLDSVLRAARGPASVEGCHHRALDSTNEAVELGPDPWEQLLTTRATGLEPGMVFGSWAIYGPSDATCACEQRSPDVFIAIRNERLVGPLLGEFNPSVLIAVGSDVAQGRAILDLATESARELLSASLVAKRRRPWGYPSPTGYHDGISEMHWFKGGPTGRKASADAFKEPWDEVVCFGSTGPGTSVAEGHAPLPFSGGTPSDSGPRVAAVGAFRRGQTVRHPTFGLGRIIDFAELAGHMSAMIDFEKVGGKTVVLQYARLEAID